MSTNDPLTAVQKIETLRAALAASQAEVKHLEAREEWLNREAAFQQDVARHLREAHGDNPWVKTSYGPLAGGAALARRQEGNETATGDSLIQDLNQKEAQLAAERQRNDDLQRVNVEEHAHFDMLMRDYTAEREEAEAQVTMLVEALANAAIHADGISNYVNCIFCFSEALDGTPVSHEPDCIVVTHGAAERERAARLVDRLVAVNPWHGGECHYCMGEFVDDQRVHKQDCVWAAARAAAGGKG